MSERISTDKFPEVIEEAKDLLMSLILVPSVSRNEDAAATLLFDWLKEKGLDICRVENNLYAKVGGFDLAKKTLMVNAHIDTVGPSASYTSDPYTPLRRDGYIYGLGSNDDGASLVSIIAACRILKDTELPFNLLLALTAEEEVSGENGMRRLMGYLDGQGITIDAALVGEPTGMEPAIAERGLIVLDCTSHGVAGHAARNGGVNAIYRAIEDIERLRGFEFDRVSPTLGPIKISVTQIDAGTRHNVIPDSCRFVVDVRTTDAYTNSETAEILKNLLESDAQERSTRVHASVIDSAHPLVLNAVAMGKTPFVSPTTSDMALLYDIPSIKMGPGESSRSHTADEFVLESEIDGAIEQYVKYLTTLRL